MNDTGKNGSMLSWGWFPPVIPMDALFMEALPEGANDLSVLFAHVFPAGPPGPAAAELPTAV
jgi:hypothetical protein